MTASQADGHTLAARYLTMLNDHDPDAVDGFVAVDYIDHDAFGGRSSSSTRRTARSTAPRTSRSRASPW